MGCLIALVVVICLVVVRGLKHSYGGSSSYSVSHMENQQKDTPPSTTNPISTGRQVKSLEVCCLKRVAKAVSKKTFVCWYVLSHRV